MMQELSTHLSVTPAFNVSQIGPIYTVGKHLHRCSFKCLEHGVLQFGCWIVRLEISNATRSSVLGTWFMGEAGAFVPIRGSLNIAANDMVALSIKRWYEVHSYMDIETFISNIQSRSYGMTVMMTRSIRETEKPSSLHSDPSPVQEPEASIWVPWLESGAPPGLCANS